MPKQTTEYKNNFKTEHYDSLNLNIAKGTKAILQDYLKADRRSLSMFIKEAMMEKYKAETGEDIVL
jgi:hypothetical protein